MIEWQTMVQASIEFTLCAIDELRGVCNNEFSYSKQKRGVYTCLSEPSAIISDSIVLGT